MKTLVTGKLSDLDKYLKFISWHEPYSILRLTSTTLPPVRYV